MPYSKKTLIFRALGLILSTVPPIVATVSFFPIWRERGAESILSGFSLMLILICAVPLFRSVKRFLHSPSMPIVWLVIFITFFALSKIAEDITVIAFTGFVSNLIGAVFFRLAKEKRGEEVN